MKIYGPYTRKDGRQVIVCYENGKRKTISYPKYLLEKKLGRKLLPDETCDHINNDSTDNRLDNLQVLSRADNAKKGMALRAKENGIFTCPICLKSFTRNMASVRHNLNLGKTGPYCSRSCAGKSSHFGYNNDMPE